MLGYEQEIRFVGIDFANDPGVLSGATLDSGQTITVVNKRGEAAVADVVLGAATDPVKADPAISGTQVRFWALLPAADRYVVRATVVLSNGETAKAEADLVVERA